MDMIADSLKEVLDKCVTEGLLLTVSSQGTLVLVRKDAWEKFDTGLDGGSDKVHVFMQEEDTIPLEHVAFFEA